MTASEWAAARGDKWLAQLPNMEAMLAPIDEPLIQAMRVNGPCRIADVGCGGGGTTLEVLRRVPAGSVVRGFDVSPSLIEFARSRPETIGSNVSFTIADVATEPVTAAAYDRLISRFGTMFFTDPPAAFGNLIRWLAPGGRFAFAVWGRLSENPWMTTIRDAVAQVIELPQTDHEAPGPFRYADAGKLLTLLDGAGAVELEAAQWRGKLRIPRPAAEAADFALASASSFAEMLAEAGGEASKDAHRLLTERFAGHERDGAVALDASVHIIAGARPKP